MLHFCHASVTVLRHYFDSKLITGYAISGGAGGQLAPRLRGRFAPNAHILRRGVSQRFSVIYLFFFAWYGELVQCRSAYKPCVYLVL